MAGFPIGFLCKKVQIIIIIPLYSFQSLEKSIYKCSFGKMKSIQKQFKPYLQ